MNTFPSKDDIENLMDEHAIPALSMIIIEGSEITLHYNLGVKSTKNRKAISSETLFEAASLSKPVFAYAVMKSVQEGTLDLDTPLSHYLSYSHECHDPRVSSITARMILSHTAGFPNWRPKNEPLKVYFQPGERFNYSGEGYFYLQQVLEKITGKNLEKYIQEKVFFPLEMSNSTFVWRIDEKKAEGHHSDGSPVEIQLVKPNSAFTLHTTALDYAKFVKAVLKDESANPMLKPQVKVHEMGTDTTNITSSALSKSLSWGLGWGLQTTSLGDAFWHWGDNQGFQCFVIGNKEKQTGLILFSNSSVGLFAISKIVNNYLKEPQPALEWIYR